MCIKKISCSTKIVAAMLKNIELDLNRGVNPFGPISRQDTKIRGCHFAFPNYFCTATSIILIKRVRLRIYLKFGIVFSVVGAGFDQVKGVSGKDSINRPLCDKSKGSNVQNITS